ncbi:ABC transporter permease [Anaerovorax odorimutans]|uniref:ABC transporter permease n=1 Tax=Anaerovorax odorimutans TaxID=109327 RepID=A0ABT1RQ57_9FIRM|nr:ABC transporter permease [Anaerovorax odorimutans]MCQ4637320.1 ABC transporter permease [Anaerovorax odorimutans]
MNLLTMVDIERRKIHRSKIIWILMIPIVILWIPMIINADVNFNMQAEGILPEDNFLVQGFLGLSWFMFPASLVIGTVLLNQTERSGNGILKMLSLPISPAKLCMAKFIVLLLLAAVQMIAMVVCYYLSAAAASSLEDYSFTLGPSDVLGLAGSVYLASIPMAAVFWMIAVCIRTPVFSVGIGLATIVPSVLVMNTKVWFAYPMCYAFRVVTGQMHKLAAHMGDFPCDLLPWIPAAVIITLVCLAVSCNQLGKAERRG